MKYTNSNKSQQKYFKMLKWIKIVFKTKSVALNLIHFVCKYQNKHFCTYSTFDLPFDHQKQNPAWHPSQSLSVSFCKTNKHSCQLLLMPSEVTFCSRGRPTIRKLWSIYFGTIVNSLPKHAPQRAAWSHKEQTTSLIIFRPWRKNLQYFKLVSTK